MRKYILDKGHKKYCYIIMGEYGRDVEVDNALPREELIALEERCYLADVMVTCDSNRKTSIELGVRNEFGAIYGRQLLAALSGAIMVAEKWASQNV